jgi:GDPmannose 4,6-dehydratase
MTREPRRALIFGISGQDGCYLAAELLEHGYEVHGTSRAGTGYAANLQRLGIPDRVHVHQVPLLDYAKVAEVVKAVAPTEIYNLAGQSSVSLSFVHPMETFTGHAVVALNILEAIRSIRPQTRFYNAASSEAVGDTGTKPADETAPLRPCTPYGAAKAAAVHLVQSYRSSFGLFACTGIMFNHESPLRPESFVTQRVVRGAIAIAQKRSGPLALGNIGIVRDWGWAPDFVESMRLMLQQEAPQDFVIATGIATSLEAFVDRVFRRLDLYWKDHVTIDDKLKRATDIAVSFGNPERARQRLGWASRVRMPELADRLVDAALSGSVR